MLSGLALALGYSSVTLLWTPSLSHGAHALLGSAAALATAVVVLLLVGTKRATLSAFAGGVLAAGAAQVLLAVVEIGTGFHVSTTFGASYLQEWNLDRIEDILGPIAIGTMGNPNDLGALFLLTISVLLSAEAFGLRLSIRTQWIAWLLATSAIVIGFTSLNDARGFQLGVLMLCGLHVLDRLRPQSRFRCLVGIAAIGVVLVLRLLYAWIRGGAPLAIGTSDSLRLNLLAQALQTTVESHGFGRGLGTEAALLETGALPINFHNVVAQLAAEAGIVIAGAYLLYLLSLLWRWLAVGRVAPFPDERVRLARASIAVGILIYGATSSGVLDSPLHWAFFVTPTLLAGVRPVRTPLVHLPAVETRSRLLNWRARRPA
jgi:hypothetical protein